MENPSLDELTILSIAESADDLKRETAQDALSIVIDAINSSVGGLIISDLSGKIRFANPAFCTMFEYSREEIIGMDAADLFTSRKVRKLSDVIAIIDIRQEMTEEFIVETKGGKRFVVEVAASNVASSSGQPVGKMASFVDITKRKEIETDRENLVSKLQNALAMIKTLEGIIRICSSCKKIRDHNGNWRQIESYIKEHSKADFSHGICPECTKKLYPELFHQV